jgi:uncharacterized protein (DUF1810 family)
MAIIRSGLTGAVLPDPETPSWPPERRLHRGWQPAGVARRLVESARALTGLDTDDPVAVLGPVDALKLRSSMTLFAQAAPEEPVFREVLDHYFGGALDEGTTNRL